MDPEDWELLYWVALHNATVNAPTLYHSRIDGALLPW